MQRIGDETEFRIVEHHIVVEVSHTCVGMVFSPVRHQSAVTIHQFAAFEIVAQVIEPVVVQTICLHDLVAMLHHHIVAHFRNLRFTVVVEFVAGE